MDIDVFEGIASLILLLNKIGMFCSVGECSSLIKKKKSLLQSPWQLNNARIWGWKNPTKLL